MKVILRDCPHGLEVAKGLEGTQCWIWPGRPDRNGYARIHINGHRMMVHRWVYQRFVGELPYELELDHLCRVRNCVNPKHLEPVTHAENMERARVHRVYARRSHCFRGHEMVSENLYYSRDRRSCKKCSAIRSAARNLRKKQLKATEMSIITE